MANSNNVRGFGRRAYLVATLAIGGSIFVTFINVGNADAIEPVVVTPVINNPQPQVNTNIVPGENASGIVRGNDNRGSGSSLNPNCVGNSDGVTDSGSVANNGSSTTDGRTTSVTRTAPTAGANNCLTLNPSNNTDVNLNPTTTSKVGDTKAQAEAAAKQLLNNNQQLKADLASSNESKSSAALQSLSKQLQNQGFDARIADSVAFSQRTALVSSNQNGSVTGANGLNLDQSNNSKNRTVVFGNDDKVQLVAPPVGNYTCRVRLGEGDVTNSAPVKSHSNVFNAGVGFDIGDGAAGKITLGTGSAGVDGVNAEQGLAVLAPCSAAQNQLTILLQGMTGDQLINRNVGNVQTTTNILGQQQQQGLGTNNPQRARQ